MQTIKLYEAPQKIKINLEASDGSKHIIFHRIDGMYSFCTTEKGAPVHLYANAELVKKDDGSYDAVKGTY